MAPGSRHLGSVVSDSVLLIAGSNNHLDVCANFDSLIGLWLLACLFKIHKIKVNYRAYSDRD